MVFANAKSYNIAMGKSLIDQIEELLDRKLDEKLDRMLDEKLDRLFDEKLDARFDAFEDKLDYKLDARFDAFEGKMDLKFGAFTEHMDDKFDGLAEALQLTNEMVGKLPTRDEFTEVKADITTIKLAVRDTNRELHGL